MKKLIASLIAGFMLTAGLVVAASSAPVHAAPYPPTVVTKVVLKAPGTIKKGKWVTATVKVVAGSASPKGTVRVQIKRLEGGYNTIVTKSYNGSPKSFKSSKLTKTGKYMIIVRFTPKSGSVFKKSGNAKFFKVA